MYTNKMNNNHTYINNNQFVKNKADVSGGCIYISETEKNNILLIEKITNINKFVDNIATSHGSNFGSSPSKIIFNNKTETKQKIDSGGAIHYEIELLDALNNLIIDNEKYYSDISLDVTLFDVDDNESLNKKDYKIDNFISTFEKGKVEENALTIYTSKPGNYLLKIKRKNNGRINENDNELSIQLEIMDCDKDRIKMYNKNKYYCEVPKCKASCPVGENANCKPYKDGITINDKEKNICECKKGYTGDSCENEVFVDFR